jgi:type 1 glutamine amidotransferase
MTTTFKTLACLLLAGVFATAGGTAWAADDWQTIFDGKTLEKWDGNPKFWHVEDGTVTGQTTADNPTQGNTFLIWRGGEPADFELKLEYKIIGGNSGIQYRSFEVPNEKWVIGGYQGDIEAGDMFSGINYGERFRGILAQRGQETVIGDDHQPKLVRQLGDSKEIQSKIKKEDWNEYHITAQGYKFTHQINGVTTSIVTDDDKVERRAKGLIALQLHAGPPMKVQFRNIRLRTLSPQATADPGASGKRKILLLAGYPSHGFGAHDHLAGCSLLARLLNASGLPVEAEVHSLQKSGWPSDDKLAAANTIVVYADGGGGHPFNAHLDQLSSLTAKGTGIVCLHYGVETPKGPPGDRFLEWIGGYFETDWSVNPHWVAHYTSFPDHPITRGIAPFSTNDEWYYHMRFRDKMAGVVPILTDLPPESTLEREDGSHSGNPAVRAAIKNKEPQHMAWATQRPDGGRGFGCTGGHNHVNWGNDSFRKLVLNAIVWTAGLDISADGVPAGTVTVDDLLKDHDEPIPADFKKASWQSVLDGFHK